MPGCFSIGDRGHETGSRAEKECREGREINAVRIGRMSRCRYSNRCYDAALRSSCCARRTSFRPAWIKARFTVQAIKPSTICLSVEADPLPTPEEDNCGTPAGLV